MARIQLPSSQELMEALRNVPATVPGSGERNPRHAELLAAADALSDLEQALANMHAAAKWVAGSAETCGKADVNSIISALGELQSKGPALDVACAIFYERQQVAREVIRKLGAPWAQDGEL